MKYLSAILQKKGTKHCGQNTSVSYITDNLYDEVTSVDNTSPHKKGKGKGQYSSSWQPHLRATGRHLPYGICHPTQVNAPRLTPGMRASTRFTYP